MHTGVRFGTATAIAVAVVVSTLLTITACGGPRRPAAPKPDRDVLALIGGGNPDAAPDLGTLLASYPLGDAPFRADLLASNDSCSVFLVQSRAGVPEHFHRTHRERAWVLAGSGTCVIGESSYPAVAGSVFNVAPQKVHRVDAEGDAPLVALAVFEPPLASIDADRVNTGK
ncbi:MAG: cupin domain-containing protein [Planctomycetes bacterium]|nr:cupin domain-containing protein [Planctomycetota bacterium]